MKTTKMRTRVAAILAAMICATSAVGGSMVSAADISNAPSTAVSTQTAKSSKAVSTRTAKSSRDELSDYIYNKIAYDKVNLSKEIQKQKVYPKCDLKDGTMTVSNVTTKNINERTSDFSIINDVKSITYPGSLIKINEDFANGTPSKITLNRKAMNFSIDCGRKKCTFKAVPQTEGNILEKVYDIIDNYSKGHDVPAQVSLDFAKASSEEQLKAQLNVGANVLKKLNINFSAINNCKQSTYVIKFRQIYYTVSAERPQNAEDVFANSVTKNTLIREGVNTKNAPAYISSVSYGREVYIVVNSSNSKTSIKAAENLEAQSFNLKSKQEWSKTLENCSVNMFILGGASGNVDEILNVKDYDSFLKGINQDLKFSPENCAYPISYTARYLGNNQLVESKTTGEYAEVTYRTSNSIPVTLKMKDMDHRIHSGTFMIRGKYIKGVDEDGRYIYGGDYYERYYFKNTPNLEKNVSIPANVDPNTIEIEFNYEGTYDHYFTQRTFKPSLVKQNIDSLVLELEGTSQFFGYKVEARAWINPKNNKDCTSKNADFYTKDDGAKK